MHMSINDGMVPPHQTHIVDWQLTRAASAAQYEDSSQELRERIKALEARARSVVRAALTDPGAIGVHRSLAVLEAEIARLRADLAWLRAEERAAWPGA